LSLQDQPNSYGWISITLHWVAVAIIVALWFIGDSTGAADGEQERVTLFRLHMSIAMLAFPLLLLRIVWRLRSGHPWIDGQSAVDHRLANTAHYVLLFAVVVMLISGPLAVWSAGQEIMVFDWFGIPGPFAGNPVLQTIVPSAHAISAKVILIVATVHMCGAFIHLMFKDDDVFLRMLVPKKKPDGEV